MAGVPAQVALPALAWVAALSLVAFAAAAWDKRQARRGRSRVRERTLLGLALVGGSPGLLAAMLVVRHKTRKVSFLVRLLAVLLFQVSLVVLVWRPG